MIILFYVFMATGLPMSMSGRVCLVTGASAGHGKAVARELAKLGATVVLGCRDNARATRARSQLIAETGNDRIDVLSVDVSSFDSIRRAAARFVAERGRLDVLVNNAGGWSQKRGVSADRLELVWATNVVGPYLLTTLLLPALLDSGAARVINVSSSYARGLNLEDVEYIRRPYSGIQAYEASKQAVRMLTWAWAERLRGKPIGVNAVCPGFMKTELARDAPRNVRLLLWLLRPLQSTPERGADTAVWLASDPEAGRFTNQFFVKRRVTDCVFRDPRALALLTDLCEQALARH
jgi:NAD(P)-dependent dehydrogenase (short-subunit alcohol dehydrogenase family)